MKLTVQRNTVYGVTVNLMVWECTSCGIVYGVPKEFADSCRETGQRYHCPNGHSLGWNDTETERLRKKLEAVQARERHLDDQLHAATAEAEAMRARILRDRQRFANGVCPCCNRCFTNVARHMTTQHPEYDPTRLDTPTDGARFKCSCSRVFESFKGLRVHQGHARSEDWVNPSIPKWRAHLTDIGR